MHADPAPTIAPEDAETRLRRVEAEAQAAGERVYADLSKTVRLLWETARFLVFVLSVLLGVVYVWLWLVGLVLACLRVLLWLIIKPLLWLSDGAPHREDGTQPDVVTAVEDTVRTRWSRRDEWYRDIARPLGRYYADAHAAGLRFWHFTVPRKVFVLAAAFFFIVVPALYVVPRPHYIQLIDDNVIDHVGGDAGVRYLVHGVDLFKPGQTREYLNEDAWWLGKINSQGMKAQLQPGRFYKVWVVGLRWWYAPRLYPNLIAVTEVDRDGNVLSEPSHLIPATTTGR